MSEEEEPLILRIPSIEYSGRSKWKMRLSIGLILCTETAERIAFYGLLCNMAIFLNSNPLHWASYNAMTAIFLFNGVSYVMSLFGGWIADSYIGKFRTILLFYIVYLAGFSIWPNLHSIEIDSDCNTTSTAPGWCNLYPAINASAMQPLSDHSNRIPIGGEICSWAVILSLIIIGIGYGGVRSNIIPFGAQQAEQEGKYATRMYFNWLYWCINVGSLVSYSGLGYVQQNISYFYGYLVPLLVLAISYLIFISGSCVYLKKKETNSNVISNIFSVVKNAFKNCFQKYHNDQNQRLIEEAVNLPPSTCLDFAKITHGGASNDTSVEDTKSFFKVLLVFAAMIPYWTIYYQMQTTFLIQGLHMKLVFNTSNPFHISSLKEFRMPASWLSICDIVTIIILVPLFDRLIYPFLDRRGLSPSLRLRVLLGMGLTVIAMVVAGVVEHFRLLIYWGEDNLGHPLSQFIACSEYKAADLNVLWQVPQYALIGASEVFSSIAGLELAYLYAPRSIQSVIIGLFYFTQGVGSFFASAILGSLQGRWFTSFDYGNINCQHSPFAPEGQTKGICHLDYYFFFLAFVQLLGLVFFAGVVVCLDVGREGVARVRERRPDVSRSTVRERINSSD